MSIHLDETKVSFVKVGTSNIRTGYFVRGENHNQTIVLLHGFGQSSSFWDALSKELSDKYQVYAIDLPCFGQSDLPDKTWGINEYSCFLIEFIEKLKIENPILIGHSMGGKIAMLYASMRKVKSLVIYSTGGISNNVGFVKKISKYLVWLLCKIYPSSVLYLVSQILKPKSYANTTTITSERAKMACNIYLTVQHGLSINWNNINCPTLLLYGMNDPIAQISNALILQNHIRRSKLVTVSGSTHFAHIENNVSFLRELSIFLDDNT